jgi:molybdopterin biosynthesis enzyme
VDDLVRQDQHPRGQQQLERAESREALGQVLAQPIEAPNQLPERAFEALQVTGL